MIGIQVGRVESWRRLRHLGAISCSAALLCLHAGRSSHLCSLRQRMQERATLGDDAAIIDRDAAPLPGASESAGIEDGALLPLADIDVDVLDVDEDLAGCVWGDEEEQASAPPVLVHDDGDAVAGGGDGVTSTSVTGR